MEKGVVLIELVPWYAPPSEDQVWQKATPQLSGFPNQATAPTCHRAGRPGDPPAARAWPWAQGSTALLQRHSGSRQLNEPGLISAAAPGETQALLGSSAPGEVRSWQRGVLQGSGGSAPTSLNCRGRKLHRLLKDRGRFQSLRSSERIQAGESH